MPVDDSLPSMATDRKSVKKQYWKEKLFSKDKNKPTPDQQVEAFLGSTQSSRPNPLLRHDAPPAAPAPPKPLQSHQWSSSYDRSNPLLPPDHPSSAPDACLPSSALKSPRKPRRRKNLTVHFTQKRPELIGEGGDEADTPPVEVSLRRNASPNPSSDDSDYLSARVDSISPPPTLPQLQIDSSFDDKDLHLPVQQQPNPQDVEFLMSLSTAPRGSRLSFRAPESSSFAQQVRAKMQAEEGHALQVGYRDEASSPTNDDERESSEYATVPTSPVSSQARSPVSAIDDGLNTPRHSPSIPLLRKQSNAAPTDRNHSQTGIQPPPSGLPRQLSVRQPPRLPDDDYLGHDRQTSLGVERKGTQRSTPQSAEPPPYQSPQPSPKPPPPQQPKFSLRSVATQFGESAFTEFKSYVTKYMDSYADAAEHVKPLMETSLTEWTRAAVWWFLRGKTQLESYARARSPNSTGSVRAPRAPPQSAKQAVVDLGKALWIIEAIIPHHAELGRYRTMGMDAMFAVASTTGDTRLSDTLSQQQALTNHLRSLAMSIKRNNILSTVTASEAPTERLDTSVWVKYPFFAPDVAAVLSGISSRSMLVGKAGNVPSTIHMMPLGDSSRYFSYGNMFVEACLSSTEDDDSQMFSMPCALSIIRDRADWYVFAAITGQSELVNILIQSDRKQGPTWDSVDWQVATFSMRVKLPRGFELDVMFQETDFKTLWNIVQYTRKTENSLQPEAGETPIFAATLKTFQYMDPGPTKAFPPEPIERCRVRLFEESVTFTEGTGTRSAHRGFRLTVVTSPKVKTLSNVKHILGNSSPIVFGLLRGPDGAPALMLKITEDGRTRSMLLAFEDVAERTSMHSLLLGIVPDAGEVHKATDLSLRSYAIEEMPDQLSGLPGRPHLQFPGGTVSVIDQEQAPENNAYGPTVLSEHLRAFVASEFGSVTDRINLGMRRLLCSSFFFN